MAGEHTLKRFDEELERLSSTISEMGGLAESQLAQSLVALRERDTETAEQVIAEDARVDALDLAVQEQTVKLLALRQPMAVDLRVILSSIKIASALERIADYAKNTAKRSILLTQGTSPVAAVNGIDRLGRLVRTALKDVLDAFAQGDVAKAYDVWQRDEEIDQVQGLLDRLQPEAQPIQPHSLVLPSSAAYADSIVGSRPATEPYSERMREAEIAARHADILDRVAAAEQRRRMPCVSCVEDKIT